jgi:hydroxyacylglutathione hydrolase
MLIESFTVGTLSTNCYVASCQKTKDAILIDPGLDFAKEAKPIFDYIEKAKLKVGGIVNTHGHDDHVKGNVIFQQKYNVPIYIHSRDAYFLEDMEQKNAPATVLLEEGSVVKVGVENLKVIHTPGHTAGSICLLGEKLVFTGDTLFACGIGRTDFPEGSMTDMRLSLQKLVRLPDTLLVYPGHGETTMIGEEKRINPFLNTRNQGLLF